MSILDDIRKLMDKLKESESQKNLANEEMKKITNNCIDEILNIFLTLADYLKVDNIVLRSYMGTTFDTGEGIIIYDKSIEEKMVLKLDKSVHYYKIENEKLIDKQLDKNTITDYITIDALFDSVKTSLIDCINKNEQLILSYRSLTAKINRYTEDLESIVRNRLLNNNVQNSRQPPEKKE